MVSPATVVASTSDTSRCMVTSRSPSGLVELYHVGLDGRPVCGGVVAQPPSSDGKQP